MADDTPDAPAADPAPTPGRRRSTRTAMKSEGAHKPARKPRAPKSTLAKAEDAVIEAASKPAAAVSRAAGKPAAAVASAAKSAAKAVKPRAAKRATPRATSRRKAEDKKTGWGRTAIAGGLAVAGAAATAAVFALRGSSNAKTPPAPPAPDKAKAHQPDGTDSSKSFAAGIADESTIPDATPAKD